MNEMFKIEKIIESSVSYKDVPVMKELLQLQKKIRNILEDWLNYCRNSLSILEPEMYIMPDLPTKDRTRFNEDHDDFQKIAFYRRKSKSAENLTTNFNLFEIRSKKFNANSNSQMFKSKSKLFRSKSAFLSKYIFLYFFICQNCFPNVQGVFFVC
jgi:hypothetical protein